MEVGHVVRAGVSCPDSRRGSRRTLVAGVAGSPTRRRCDADAVHRQTASRSPGEVLVPDRWPSASIGPSDRLRGVVGHPPRQEAGVSRADRRTDRSGDVEGGPRRPFPWCCSRCRRGRSSIAWMPQVIVWRCLYVRCSLVCGDFLAAGGYRWITSFCSSTGSPGHSGNRQSRAHPRSFRSRFATAVLELSAFTGDRAVRRSWRMIAGTRSARWSTCLTRCFPGVCRRPAGSASRDPPRRGNESWGFRVYWPAQHCVAHETDSWARSHSTMFAVLLGGASLCFRHAKDILQAGPEGLVGCARLPLGRAC